MKLLSFLPFFLICLVVASSSLAVYGASDYVFVGAWFYTWYEEGAGTSHWNTTIGAYNTVVDVPLLGYYSSNDSEVIKQQLNWIDGADIDFLIHAWWGYNDHTDNSSQVVYNITDTFNFDVSHAICLEPFNGTGGYNWTKAYDYIWDSFVVPYNCYFKLHGKPLLCILEQCFEGWGDDPVTNRNHFTNDDDSRFVIRIVGSHWVADWFYGDVDSQLRVSQEDGVYDFSHRLNIDGAWNIFPRFDEYYLNRDNPCRLDWDYSLGLYSAFWDAGLDYGSRLHIVLITSWNEFHERHAIEPCKDYTAYHLYADNYYAYDLTCVYIELLRSGGASDEGGIWYQNPLSFGLVVFGLALGLYFMKRRY